ncbi:MAG: hypothetical protein JO166_15230 [Deltaproteobacteria bacterium]|nr:hypothetical protein [Deltaproteobacteria bacterium]
MRRVLRNGNLQPYAFKPRDSLSARGLACSNHPFPVMALWRGRLGSSRLTFALMILTILSICVCSEIGTARAAIVCADDVIPSGMAVTATGTAASCAGACRAREIEPVCGPIMKICAGQPVPKGYALDSITTMPACRCLGASDDGYVIRYTGNDDQTVSPYRETDPEQSPYSEDDPGQTGYAYGNPPFGNLLCTENWSASRPYHDLPGGSQAYGSASQSYGAGPQLYDNLPSTGPRGGLAAPDNPQWTGQQSDPFRVGQ